jgi:hypothetical protein
MLDPGFEPGLPRPQRGVLTARLIELLLYISDFFWRCWVSIPVPRACKARTLPTELHPHIYLVQNNTLCTFYILKNMCGIGLVGYDDCLTCSRSRVRTSDPVKFKM